MTSLIKKSSEFLSKQLPALTGFCIKVLLAIVVFCVGRKLIDWLINRIKSAMERAGIDQGVLQFAASLSKVALYVLLIFSIATNFGVTETSVAALLGTSGLTLGLGLQGGLTNLVGGIMILLFKPYQVGDYIMVGSETSGIEGTISKIEMFYTTLATLDNKRIVVPNGTLSNSSVINVTAKDERKLEIKVGISYESSIVEAKKILTELMLQDPAIKSEQEMLVFVHELGESSVVLGLRAWVATGEYWASKWRLNEKIKLAFDEAGIVIPYNQMCVHLENVSES